MGVCDAFGAVANWLRDRGSNPEGWPTRHRNLLEVAFAEELGNQNDKEAGNGVASRMTVELTRRGCAALDAKV